MKKTLIVTLAIEVDELPENERQECAEMCGESVDEIPGVADISGTELAGLIPFALEWDDHNREAIWAGSEMYARIAKVTLVEGGWKQP